jgi:nuclear GTP-binding protein
MVLHDWQRGKIPFFVPPPQQSDDGASEGAEPVEKTEEDGVSSDRTAAAMKAIARIISSQQDMSVPCHKEHDGDNADSGSEDNEDNEVPEQTEEILGTDLD